MTIFFCKAVSPNFYFFSKKNDHSLVTVSSYMGPSDLLLIQSVYERRSLGSRGKAFLNALLFFLNVYCAMYFSKIKIVGWCMDTWNSFPLT